MSDNLRRYRAIRDALTQWYPDEPQGSRYPRAHARGTLAEVICFSSGIHPRAHARGPLRTVDRARHLTTLAALISGIVAGKSSHLPKIASQVPDGTKPESRVKRFTR